MSDKRYHTGRWRKASKAFLNNSDNALCKICLLMGIDEPATIVDHIIPHRGRSDRFFWDQDNWQGLCATCHSRHKQIKEKSGTLPGCDINGIPLDNDHFWSKL